MMEGPVRTVLVLACLLSVQPWLAGTALSNETQGARTPLTASLPVACAFDRDAELELSSVGSRSRQTSMSDG